MSLHPEIDYAQHSGDHSDGGPNSNSLPNHPTLSLPSEILHPDDAKDKVFTAILKALVVLDNKPSSPKELANCIIKHRFTLLGGATPYATVSSRISQHFKRALEHKPPRAPLLARIVDEHHSRKIHYYLANEAVRAGLDRFTSIPSQPQPQPPQPLKPLKEFTHLEGGYPKLKILLKKRKNSMLGNHVFKRYKTMLSGARPGVGTGRGKGKWAPHAHYRSSTRVCADNNSGSGSDADIDEVDSDSGNESPSDLHASTTTGGALSCDPSFSQPLATASLESREAIKEPPLDGEYSDYFEEMMNGDWYMDSYEADPLATKQNKASPPPSAQRASSNTAGNRANPGPSNTAPRTPARKAAETELSQENAVLLTPDTASLFGREFDSHLIPNFGDEFAADSAYAPLMDLNNPETLPMSELDEIFNGSPRRHDLTPRRLFEDHSPMRTHLSHDITRPENPQGSMDISKHCDDPRLPSQGDVSLMDVDAEPLNDTHEPCAAVPEVTSSSNASSHTAMTTGGASDDPLEGAYPMSLTIDEFIPKVTNKIYSNIQVYEVVLPEPPYRLMRFHSNVATPPNDPKCHGRSVVILEESRHKDFCNASLLRKAARTYESHGKPERNDAYTRFVVIRNGPPECRGVWVSLERARQLAAEYGIQDVPHIQQLLSRDPLSENRETMYDPVEMDKHLVELSGILTTNPTPEYDFAQESNLEDETRILPKPARSLRIPALVVQRIMSRVSTRILTSASTKTTRSPAH
ncbi:hypothetical protein K493DRAFT_63318 [Basidiobolus meristosporus CBS 931.73]|uniref:GDS1 winged helix domain-containing protein n=1 Tax=Basidiobolus meristosporus CBS 931.73 TaxID=1314790 RepID=A0A1Y1XW63_9FUNG|nr:hypothetical protein K493DRAFT_63318 [Basidiobolus meristosporus CBS 931.73]|eukprot:ORX89989.1 hypothetical protein K493DRAFT_63318 [Basidiobolus meristosporus CBS 931.73]